MLTLSMPMRPYESGIDVWKAVNREPDRDTPAFLSGKSGYDAFMGPDEKISSKKVLILDYIFDMLPFKELYAACKKLSEMKDKDVFMMSNSVYVLDMARLLSVYSGNSFRFMLSDGKILKNDDFYGRFLPLMNYLTGLHDDLKERGFDCDGNKKSFDAPVPDFGE